MNLLTPANRITDAAYDALMMRYKHDRDVFHAAHEAGGLRKLCVAYGINPDAG